MIDLKVSREHIDAIDKQIVELDSFGDEVNADARSQLLSIKI